MPTISLVTAVLAGLDEHIGETYESLLTQELPAGWEWEWVVQEDGETGEVAERLPRDDSRVSFDTGRHGRAAAARTLAMARVTGKYVRALDADDRLTPGALARDIEILETQPVGWVCSPAIDVFPDGTEKAGPRDPRAGLLPRTTMYDGEKAGLLPVLGTTVTAYADLVRALGAWQALTLSEDVALMIALEAAAPGWMLDEPSLWYRKWPSQTTADKTHDATPWGPGRDVVLGRADALRALGWSWNPPAH